ncbi:MAG: ATP-grasp domain-containing protein [Candidatus Paceibacterota bacterium]|jgi:D-alanine-D-alanine ligase|nr:ATP-grasp domain-containing protein [Candidatus Paceibacterota bacterium]HPD55494.1 ATP-grasp domain-containing protein [Candidatus Paceibacterota bacterium]HQM35015.1 ATP-grasp domain-containing protein [Candidatus Paceibacterota bacterium]
MKIIIVARNLKGFKKINNTNEDPIIPESSTTQTQVDTYGRVNLDDALAIKKILDKFGHEVKILQIDIDLFEQLKIEKPDLIFNLADDGFYDDPRLEPHVAALFDILKIPYTGNNYFTLALCQNKARAKEILTYNGILTPKWQVFNNCNRKLNPTLRFPLIVKPIREDGSVGIKERSVVKNEEELKEQISHILDVYQQEALVEEFIDGREFNIGIIGNKKLTVLPIAEIDFSELPPNIPRVVSYRAKWVKQSIVFKKTPVICPANISDKLQKDLEEISKKCYKIFGCQGYARLDVRYDEKEDKIYVLELNPNPDISEDGGLAREAKTGGMSYENLILKILDLALKKEF